MSEYTKRPPLTRKERRSERKRVRAIMKAERRKKLAKRAKL